VTEEWEQSTNGSAYRSFGSTNGVNCIEVVVPTAPGVTVSVATLPAGCTIVDCYDDVTTGYDGALATIAVGTPLFPTAFLSTTESTASVANLYTKRQRVAQAAAEVVQVTRAGAAGAVGAATVLVFYTTPEV
jgi:hypothetical protein